MIGINLDKINQVINNENVYLENLSELTEKLKFIVGDLSDAYSGATLNFISSILSKQIDNIQSINSLLNSYLILLNSVKKGYVSQEEVFAQQLNNKLN